MLNTTTSMRLQITQANMQEISYAQAHKQETSNAQAQLQETSNAQAHKQETYNQTNLHKIVWVWTLDIQSVVFTIQISYRLLRL